MAVFKLNKSIYTCVIKIPFDFLAAMLVSSDAFGDAVREVYEPEWPGRDKLIQHLEVGGWKIPYYSGNSH